MIKIKGDMLKVLFIALILVSISVNVASAEFDNLEIENTEISDGEDYWLNQFENDFDDLTLEGEVACEEDADLNLETPEGSEELDVESGSFEFSFIGNELGAYSLKFGCNGSETETSVDFTVNDLSVNTFWYEKATVYQRETQSIIFDIEVEGANPDLDEVSLLQTYEEIDIYDLERVSISQNQLEYNFKVSTSEDPEDNLEIFWDLEFNDFVLQPGTEDTFELREPWRVVIPERFVEDGVSYQDLRSNGELLEMYANYRGDRWGFRPDHFRIEVESDDGNTVFSENEIQTRSVDGNTILEISDEQMERIDGSLTTGEFEFNIYIDENEDKLVESFKVYNYVVFEGTLTNSNGNPVDAFFDIERDGDRWRAFNTDDGRYSEVVLPGFHNVTIETEDNVKFKFDNVEFGADGNRRLMYDRIPTNDLEELEGVSVVKASGVLFGYPFEDGSASIQYDFGDINAEDARVLECKEWSMERECRGEWETIDENSTGVDPTVPEVTFPIEADRLGDQSYLISAYALAENENLIADVEIGSSSVPIGTGVNFEGEVSASGSSVEDVDITVKILDRDGDVRDEASAVTNQNGVFGVSLQAPSEEGVYDVVIKGEKPPYTSFRLDESGAIDTFVKRGVDLEGPDQEEFRTGETTSLSYVISNTGQEDLEEVRFRISGLNNEWYDLDQESWDVLESASSETVNVDVVVPDDYFDEENLENIEYQVEARGVSSEGEHNSIKSTIATITNEHQYSEDSSNEVEASSNDFGMPNVSTGEFFQDSSTLNMALGLIIVFSMVLAAAVKRSEKDDRSSRGRGGGSRLSTGNSRSASVKGASQVKPSVQPQVKAEGETESVKDDETESVKDDENDETEQDKVEEDNTSEDMVCDVCGESFDTESGLKLHKQALH